MNFRGRYRDLIAPDKLHVLSISILIDSLEHTKGGVGANIAYNLALLKEQPILLASIGQDGSAYANYLTNLGIDTSHLHHSQLPTSTFTVLTDQDDNQVGGFYPGAMSDSDSLSLEAWYRQNPLVVVSAYDPQTMKRLVQEAREHHLRLVYDIGQQVTNVQKEDLQEGIATAECLIVNDYELGVLTKRSGISESELKSKVPIVVTTLGAQGCVIEGTKTNKPVRVQSVPKIKAIDPTGAGDGYRAGFLYGYIRDWDLLNCARLGSVVASYAVETKGTQEHSFGLAELKDRYYHTYGHEIRL